MGSVRSGLTGTVEKNSPRRGRASQLMRRIFHSQHRKSREQLSAGETAFRAERCKIPGIAGDRGDFGGL
jgi:hypothetical protein